MRKSSDKVKKLIILPAVFMIFGIVTGCNYHKVILVNIEPTIVKKKMETKSDIILLDVRTKEEYEGELGHLDGAILIPVQELDDRINELIKFKEKEIIVYCRSGNRSVTGGKILLDNGFKNVKNMPGGMRKWNSLFVDPPDKDGFVKETEVQTK